MCQHHDETPLAKEGINQLPILSPWPRFKLLVFMVLLVVIGYRLELHYIEQNLAREDHLSKIVEDVLSYNNLTSEASTSKEEEISNPIKFKKLEFETCRFPEFYDPRHHLYNLSKSSWVESGWKRRQELKTMSYKGQEIPPPTNHYYQMLLRKEQPRFGFANLTIDRNISFVHIGKSSGSSVGCHLAESRRYVRKHCESDSLMRRPVPMSALSLSASCYTHWSGHMHCYDVNDAFLVNVRHPVKRMASWFLYEHVRNHQVNYAEREYHCGDIMLFSCYESFDELLSIGLKEPKPSKTQELRIGPKLTATECSHWAWAAVQGSIPAAYHNFYNYDWYTHHMFKSEEPKDLFVLRSEHFEQDWRAIDNRLGGTGYFPKTLQSPQNSAKQKKLPVSNRTATSSGIHNLCRALCKEIQTYKRILTLAVNLDRADLDVSLKELQEVCPGEQSLSPRSCTESTSGRTGAR